MPVLVRGSDYAEDEDAIVSHGGAARTSTERRKPCTLKYDLICLGVINESAYDELACALPYME